MLEKTPIKHRGDFIKASEWSEVAGVTNRISSSRPGSYISGIHSGSIDSSFVNPPFIQGTVEISSEKEDDNGDRIVGMWNVRFLYYNSIDEEWAVDDRDWDLDTGDIGGDSFVVGNRLTAYWNEQRMAFIPCVGGVFRAFELDEDLIPRIVDTNKTDITQHQTIGHFLDDSGDPTDTIDLFPATTQTEAKALYDGNYPAAVHLWLGIGRSVYLTPGGLVHNGTRGIAKWVSKAYQDENDKWIGQWQIVYLNSSLIAHARVSGYDSPGSSSVDHNHIGYAKIWWNTGSTTSPVLTEADGNNEVQFFNSASAQLYIGDNVLLSFNCEEGVWYKTDDVLTRRVVLTADYVSGDSTFTGYFWDDPAQTSTTFYPWNAYGLGIGRASSTYTETRAWAQYAYNSDISAYCWEIVDGDFATIAEGKPDANIEHHATGTVSIWWQDPSNASVLIDSTKNVTALNETGVTVTPGQRLILYYNRAEGQWIIIHVMADPSLKFYNNSGEEVSAYAVMAVDDCLAKVTSEEKCVKIVKPSSTYHREYVVNEATAVAVTASGRCHDTGFVLVAYDSGTPTKDEVWVPKAGQWTLTKELSGHSEAWHVVVAGIYDAANKILIGRIVAAEPPSLKFKNGTTGEAPAYGVMAVLDAIAKATSEEKCVSADKPSSGYYREYVVNGPTAVATSDYGRCHDSGFVLVAYDSGTPANNEIWVPKAGQWTLTKNTGVTAYGWHVVVAGVYDSTNKILIGRIVAPPPLIPFILYDDITPGETSTGKNAYLMKSDYTAESSQTILVYDGILKNSRAYGSQHFSPADTTKAGRGFAIQHTDGKLHIVSLNATAKRCQCQLAAALASTDASVSVDTVVPIDDGMSPVTSSSSTLTAYNRRNTSNSGGYEGVDNEVMYIEYNSNTGHWEFYDGPCKA